MMNDAENVISSKHSATPMFQTYLDKGFIIIPCELGHKHAGYDQKSRSSGYPSGLRSIFGPYTNPAWRKYGETRVLFTTNEALNSGKQFNWLLVTGKCSNVIVMDFDEYGTDSPELNRLFSTFKFLKFAPRATTPSGGVHIYLPYLEWFPKTVRVRDVIDIQSNGVHVVISPSVAVSKITHRLGAYRWQVSLTDCGRAQWDKMKGMLDYRKDEFLALYDPAQQQKYLSVHHPVRTRLPTRVALSPPQFDLCSKLFHETFKIELYSVEQWQNGFKLTPKNPHCVVRAVKKIAKHHKPCNFNKNILFLCPSSAKCMCFVCKNCLLTPEFAGGVAKIAQILF